MRQGPNGRRPPRGRHHNGGGDNRDNRGDRGNGGGGGGGNVGINRPRSASSLRHQSFDSNCGDLRVRGNAWQVYEKYQGLARDATSAGDRVAAENYLQHAEHYFRIIEAIDEATAAEQRQRGPQFDGQPAVPTNYYAPDGTLAQPTVGGQPPQSGNPNGNVAPTQQPQPQPVQQAEATVQSTRAPQPAPFFTQEEIDEHNGEQPLAVAR